MPGHRQYGDMFFPLNSKIVLLDLSILVDQFWDGNSHLIRICTRS